MTISDAARATRKYRKKGLLILNSETLKYEAGNDAKCDRLNMLAVLDAIREPIGVMVDAGYGYTDPADIWRAMIDAAIKEVRKAGNDA